jgi:hypothetical protein
MPAAGDVVLDPPRPSVDELAQGLVLRVMAAGGVLVGSRPGGYDDLLASARRAPGLPPGKQLRSRPARRWSPGALVICTNT